MSNTSLNLLFQTISKYGSPANPSSLAFEKLREMKSTFSNSDNAIIRVNPCSFMKTINSQVIFDSNEYGAVFSSNISSISSLFMVSHCQFMNIFSDNPSLVYQNSLGTFLVDSTLFYSCISTGHVGGIQIESSLKSVINNCCFRRCKAPSRQAIWARYSSFFDFFMNSIYQCSPKDSKGGHDSASIGIMSYMNYHSINTTDCHVTDSSVSLQLRQTKNTLVQFSSFYNNSDAHTSFEGSVAIWDVSNFTMRFNNLIGLVYSSYCVSIDALSNITMHDCVFQKNSRTKHIYNLGILQIFSCYFDVSTIIAGINSLQNFFETQQPEISLVHLNTFYCIGKKQAITFVNPLLKPYDRITVIFFILS